MSYPIAICLKMLEITTHSIHVPYIYLHLVDFYGKLVGKYTSTMDPMGCRQLVSVHSVYSFVHRSGPLKYKLETGNIGTGSIM